MADSIGMTVAPNVRVNISYRSRSSRLIPSINDPVIEDSPHTPHLLMLV